MYSYVTSERACLIVRKGCVRCTMYAIILYNTESSGSNTEEIADQKKAWDTYTTLRRSALVFNFL